MAFRPPKERIDAIAAQVLKALQEANGIDVVNPNETVAIFRGALTRNLQDEHEIEEEVMATLRQHGQQIYEQDADFQKMLYEGKKIIARKKNFKL